MPKAKPTVATVLELFGGAEKMGIKVEQAQNKAALFTVTYGLQVKTDLGYHAACTEIGACILHWLSCAGTVNNEGTY